MSGSEDFKFDEDLENKTTAFVVKVKNARTPFNIDPDKYHSYAKLIRVTAFCVCFLCQKFASHNILASPNVDALQYAKLLWILFGQFYAFSEIIKQLKDENEKKKI